MSRTITIFGSDNDFTYSNYSTIKEAHFIFTEGEESLTIKVLDVEETEDLTGENTEYIDGELSNNNEGRRQWDITCEPFSYSTDSGDLMTLEDLYFLRRLLKKKYLWANFQHYETESESSWAATAPNVIVPVVLSSTKAEKNNEKGLRYFNFTLKHRWSNDIMLNHIGDPIE